MKRVYCAFGALAMLMITCSVRARLFHLMKPAELQAKSDLIVIAEPIETIPFNETWESDGWGTYQAAMTRFKVLARLKGQSEDQEITLIHFHHVSGGVGIGNPGTVIIGRTSRGVGPSQYLLYLTRRKDGRYEPTSGRMDPEFSVLLLVPADGSSPPETRPSQP